MDHLNQNNILIENRHGFRTNQSCVTQLITLTEDISLALDHHKAFDKVPHQRLLTKLRYYGINTIGSKCGSLIAPSMLCWIVNFMSCPNFICGTTKHGTWPIDVFIIHK